MKVRTALCAVIASVLFASCGGVSVGSTYVGNADLGAFTKAPSEWKSEVVQSQPEFTMHGFWAPGGSKATLLEPNSAVSGVVIRRLPTTEEQTDLDYLGRTVAFTDLEQALEEGYAVLSEGPTDTRVSKLSGERLIFDLQTDSGTLRVLQVSVANRVKGEVYGVVIGCSVKCFNDNRATIDSIAKDFRLNQ
ncbi:MAG: hypothetical protein FJW13_02860 [Actinobacteria bacterium]|nr:hypothetical protein [Actinomycetota bacterium]